MLWARRRLVWERWYWVTITSLILAWAIYKMFWWDFLSGEIIEICAILIITAALLDLWSVIKKAEEVKKVTHLEDCASVICWNIFTTAFHTVFYFKEKVPPNMKVLSSCTRSHVVPNLYEFSVFCGTEKEKFGRNSELALFYAITVNGDWRFQALKKKKQKRHISIIKCIYMTICDLHMEMYVFIHA